MKKLFFIALLLLIGVNVAHADTTQMNNNLVRLVNQIDAMMPIIDSAKAEQDPTARMQFHFDTWTDAQGEVHLGLRQDLMMIRAALIDQINGTNLTPVTVQPLENDFTGR
jgi:hypothetical protein